MPDAAGEPLGLEFERGDRVRGWWQSATVAGRLRCPGGYLVVFDEVDSTGWRWPDLAGRIAVRQPWTLRRIPMVTPAPVSSEQLPSAEVLGELYRAPGAPWTGVAGEQVFALLREGRADAAGAPWLKEICVGENTLPGFLHALGITPQEPAEDNAWLRPPLHYLPTTPIIVEPDLHPGSVVLRDGEGRTLTRFDLGKVAS